MMKRRHASMLFFAIMVLCSVQFSCVTSVSAYQITRTNDETRKEAVDDVGSYPITYSVLDDEGNVIAETKRLTVTRRRTVVDKKIKEAIDASDLGSSSGAFDSLSDQQLIDLSGAKAWDISNNTRVEITKVIREKISQNAHYQVLFVTEHGIRTSINVIESEDIGGDVIYANFSQPTKTTLRGNIIRMSLSVLSLVLPLPVIANYLYIKRQEKKVKEILYSDNL